MTTDQKFKIVHLASSERWTGVADPVVSLATQQQRAGHEVWLGCVPGGLFQQTARRCGLRILEEIKLDRRLHPLHLLSDVRILRRFFRENGIEIVHTHLLNDNWLAATALNHFRGRHLLVRTFHRWEKPRRDPLHRYLFTQRNHLSFTTSKSLLSLFDGRLSLPPETSRVVYGGVDTDLFNPTTSGESVRREFGLNANTPLAGYISRLNHGRGHDWLLDAVPDIVRRLPEARIMISGRGPLKKPLRERVAGSSLREHVIMSPFRTNDLCEAYASLDVALFLGLGSEGTCRAALEAMATGKPVIAPRSSALPEIINDGKTGLLVEPGDRQSLADALVRLLSNREERESMGRAARLAVLERFTEAHRAEATLEAYRKVWREKFGQDD